MAGAGARFPGPQVRLLPPLLLMSLSSVLTAAAGAESVVLPWIAKAPGPAAHSSDLSILNPGSEPIEVTPEQLRKILGKPRIG